jgi:ADP-heptose:LPS heptosyltransferase
MTADRAKVYSTLDQWEPVLRTPGVVFVNLQYDDCSLALATAADQFGVKVHAMSDLDLRNDFEGTAALMQNLDLVLTIASSTGELAGALGRPVWRLLPSPPTDWTMLGHADRRPWYPTMRVFTADRVGDWSSVFSRVTSELAAFVQEHAR